MKQLSRILAVLLIFALLFVPVCAESLPVATLQTDPMGNLQWVNAPEDVILYKSTDFASGSQRSNQTLPLTYDARNHALQTSVKEQGVANSCWAIAATDILHMNLLHQGLSAMDFSEAHLMWFTHRSRVYSTDRTTGDGTLLQDPFMHGGNWVDSAAALSAWSGPVFESEFPYHATDISAMGGYDESARKKREAVLTSAVCYYAKDTNQVASLSAEQMQSIKNAIMQNGAVQMSYFSDVSKYNESVNGTAYYQNTYTATNHAIVVVGWDDTFSAKNFLSSRQPASDGAWLCKNSWDESWGDDGYFWISYEEPSLNQIVSFTADDKYAYADNYQYDGFGFHGRVYSNDYIRFVNVFTADSDCAVSAIGTWFLQYDSSFSVDVYTDIADDFSSAEKAMSLNGTVKDYGYHVLDLPAGVAVEKGERFAVAVTLTVNENCPTVNAPIENKDAEDYTSYSETGQSFVQIARNGIWYDTSAEGLNNVCLKALTLHEHTSQTVGSVCAQCGATVSLQDSQLFRRLLSYFWLIISNMI